KLLSSDNHLVQQWVDKDFENIIYNSDLIYFNHNGYLCLMSLGGDPQFFMQNLNALPADGKLAIEMAYEKYTFTEAMDYVKGLAIEQEQLKHQLVESAETFAKEKQQREHVIQRQAEDLSNT